MKRGMLILLVSTLVATAPAFADRSVNETVKAAADGMVSVEVISGEITIVGWDRDEVEVSGTLGDDVELDISSDEGDVEIEAEYENNHGRRNQDSFVVLEIHVPRSAEIEVEAISGEVTIEDVAGSIGIECVSGQVKVRGSIVEAEIETVSGRIDVATDRPLREGSFETVSGSIEYRGSFDKRGRFDFGAVSGTVTLYLDDDVSADFDISTFSGNIRNDLGPKAERDSEYGPGQSLEFSLGGGGAEVEVEVFSGSVSLKSN